MIIPVALEELKSKPKFPLFFVGDGKKTGSPLIGMATCFPSEPSY